ncbi:acyl carrier protein-like protein, partial [Kalaharituber pfeilii]
MPLAYDPPCLSAPIFLCGRASRALYHHVRTDILPPPFSSHPSAVLRAARTFTVPRVAAVAPRVAVPRAVGFPTKPAFSIGSIRYYSAPASLTKEQVEGRILDLLKGFDKVTDDTKLTPTAHFVNDLGLDSLDTVEVVMAIEEEFSIEIPDKEADAIHSVDQAVKYILSQPD